MARLILVMLILAAGIVVFGPASQAPPESSRSGPAPIPTPRVVAGVLAEAQAGEVAVEIGEAELSRLVSEQIVGRTLADTPLGPATVESLRVSLQSGRADAAGSARLGSMSVPITSGLSLSADGAGGVKVQLLEARVGSMVISDAGLDPVESLVQWELDRLLARQPIRVRRIEIGDGRLRAIGSPP